MPPQDIAQHPRVKWLAGFNSLFEMPKEAVAVLGIAVTVLGFNSLFEMHFASVSLINS